MELEPEREILERTQILSKVELSLFSVIVPILMEWGSLGY